MKINNEFINGLDSVLLSKDVHKSFYSHYKNNQSFRITINKVIPEVYDCKNQKQRGVGHLYNVLDHTLHTVSFINEQSVDLKPEERRLLAYTMFFHDLGKPKCHTVTFRNMQVIDRFVGHNIESAKIAKRLAPIFGFKETEVKKIFALVERQGIFSRMSDEKNLLTYQIRLNDKFMKRLLGEYEKIGDADKLAKYTAMLGRAESYTLYPKLASTTLNFVSRYEALLENIMEESKALGNALL